MENEEGFFGRFFKRGKKNPYGVMENELYAYKIEPSDIDTRNFGYYLIMTKIGVGDYGSDSIRLVHFSIKLRPVATSNPEQIQPIEVVQISPTDERKVVGYVSDIKEERGQRKGMIDAEIGSGGISPFLQAQLQMSGRIVNAKVSESFKTRSYENELLVTRSIGAGTDAIWEFRQGDGAPLQGQYPLNVLFRIRNAPTDITELEGKYEAVPMMMINRKELKEKDSPEKLLRPLIFLS